MKPFPFLFFFPYSQRFSGGAQSTLNLVTHLDREVLHPVLVSQQESPLTERARRHGVETCILPFPDALDVYDSEALDYSVAGKLRSLAALLQYNRRVAQVARRTGARGLWARSTKGVLLTGFAARRLGRPLVWDVGLGRASEGWMRLLHWLSLGLASMVVAQAPSQPAAVFDALAARVFEGKFHPIRPGLDPGRVEALQRPAEQDETDDAFRILSVGLISPRKNQLLLLRAVRRLLHRFPQVQVHVAGGHTDEAYRARLRRYVEREGLGDHVSFLGYRDDVPRLMHESDLLVLTSRNEGVPHVVREAMYAGLPVVATAVGGVPDIVRDCETGLLFDDADDPAPLEDALAQCLADPEARKRRARRAEAFVREAFSMKTWAADYNELLLRLC